MQAHDAYLSAGEYFNSIAGLTTFCPHFEAAPVACAAAKDGSYLFAAYRVHTDDPLFVKPGGYQTWRNGDTSGCSLDPR